MDRETEQNSEAQYLVHKSYLDVEYESPWQPARVHRIRNNTLDTEYEGNYHIWSKQKGGGMVTIHRIIIFGHSKV